MIGAGIGAIASSVQVSSGAGKTVNINLTDTGHNATTPNWNNYYASLYSTPKSLLDTSGSSTGWSIVSSITALSFYSAGGTTAATANFPFDIVNETWYQNEFNDLVIVISGLNILKSYDINILLPVEPGATYVENYTQVYHGLTSTSHNIGLISSSVEDLYSGVFPRVDGTFQIIVSTDNGNLWISGGIIIKEN